MKKFKIKKIFESSAINESLSDLCNIRKAIFYQDKNRANTLIDTFKYNFEEIEFIQLFEDNDKIYVIQTASNKFIEVEKDDLEKFVV